MLWITLALLLVTLCVSELPARGVLGLISGVLFAAGFVASVVLGIAGLELEAAQQAQEWLVRGWEMYPLATTAALAALGLLLSMGGATRLVDRVALVDPDAPLPNLVAPGLICGLGLLLLVLVYNRL
jgi:hypothetical protein